MLNPDQMIRIPCVVSGILLLSLAIGFLASICYINRHYEYNDNFIKKFVLCLIFIGISFNLGFFLFEFIDVLQHSVMTVTLTYIIISLIFSVLTWIIYMYSIRLEK